MDQKLQIFVSSSILELLDERRIIKDTLDSFPLTRSWIFEYTPASTDPLEISYLSKVKECDLFLLLVGSEITNSVRKHIPLVIFTN